VGRREILVRDLDRLRQRVYFGGYPDAPAVPFRLRSAS
jgi:hypothetical protein